MNISSLIEVFKMEEITPKKRARLIILLGNAINETERANLTEALVYELVAILDEENPILKDQAYLRHL